jgi:hypothetical protein
MRCRAGSQRLEPRDCASCCGDAAQSTRMGDGDLAALRRLRDRAGIA